ncbi:YaaL family protein [Clostridium sp. MSJ-4]|uniref:YaaL family protein n=1 Tax=Clostridium simiarum TaxID=2841506 RepID=A0ABS6F4A9_9CLOT|nr:MULTISPECIES: DUF2508 family protein [Clostridium]MBU5593352.1 YaaL family protein [Clostridium simiarum]
MKNKIGLKKSEEYTKEQLDIIQSLEETISELEAVRKMFDDVSDPKLIEVAIYSEQALKAKYEYLLFQARGLNIKLDEEFIYVRSKCIL